MILLHNIEFGICSVTLPWDRVYMIKLMNFLIGVLISQQETFARLIQELHLYAIDATDFRNPLWVRGYIKHTTPARVQAKTHGKTRAGEVCFSLEPKRDFQSPWHLCV